MARGKHTQQTKRRATDRHYRRTKLMAHAHTGRVRPHHHTSYGALAAVLLLAFLPLLLVSRDVSALTLTGGGQYDVYGVVPAPQPKTAPVITTPAIGQTFTNADPVAVRGSCPTSTLIKVFKNDVMTGAALCQNGSFSVAVGLFSGSNSLTAQAYNANDQPGPLSVPVTVTLQLPGMSLGSAATLGQTGAPAGQLYMTADILYRGVEADSAASWTINIAGGQPPYAVDIGWGDGKTSLVSRPAAGPFTVSHAYAVAPANGNSYTITAKATDQAADSAFLQLLALVSGGKQPILTVARTGGGIASLKLAWQLLAAAVLAVVSFWLGERREVWALKRHGQLRQA